MFPFTWFFGLARRFFVRLKKKWKTILAPVQDSSESTQSISSPPEDEPSSSDTQSCRYKALCERQGSWHTTEPTYHAAWPFLVWFSEDTASALDHRTAPTTPRYQTNTRSLYSRVPDHLVWGTDGLCIENTIWGCLREPWVHSPTVHGGRAWMIK